MFAAAMVMFEDPTEATRTQGIIRRGLQSFHRRPEFKFNKTSFEVKDKFFESVQDCKFLVRAIVVEKARIWSPVLRSNDETFYRFFIKSMIKFDNQSLRNARVVIDGSGERSFRTELQAYLRKHASTGAIAKVSMRDSAAEPLLQLADMCVGAIARSCRHDREESDRWRRMIKPKIDDVWEFK